MPSRSEYQGKGLPGSETAHSADSSFSSPSAEGRNPRLVVVHAPTLPDAAAHRYRNPLRVESPETDTMSRRTWSMDRKAAAIQVTKPFGEGKEDERKVYCSREPFSESSSSLPIAGITADGPVKKRSRYAAISRVDEITAGLKVREIREAVAQHVFGSAGDEQNGIEPVPGMKPEEQTALWNTLSRPEDGVGEDRTLTVYQQRELVLKIARQDPDFRHARNVLVEGHKGLEGASVNVFRNRGKSWDDLLGAANLGLVEGAEKYDPAKGDFAGFAVGTMRGKAMNLMRDDQAVYMPKHDREKVSAVLRVVDQLTGENADTPSVDDIVKAVNENRRDKLTPADVTYALMPVRVVSFEEWTESNDAALDYSSNRDNDAGEQAPNPELLGAVSQLPPHLQEVVSLRFGEGMSQREIASVVGRDRKTVAKYLETAVEQVKAYLERDADAPYDQELPPEERARILEEKRWFDTISNVSRGDAVKYLRVSMNLTREEFSRQTGVSMTSLERLEIGKGSVHLHTINKIIDASTLDPEGKAAQVVRLKSQDLEPMTIKDLQAASIGKIMKYLRVSRGVSQVELSKLIPLSASSINAIESTNSRPYGLVEIIDDWVQLEPALKQVIEQKVSDNGVLDQESLVAVAAGKFVFIDTSNGAATRHELKDMEVSKDIESAESIGSAFELLLGYNDITEERFYGVMKDTLGRDNSIAAMRTDEHMPYDITIGELMKNFGYDIHHPFTQAMIRRANRTNRTKKRLNSETELLGA